MGARGYGVVGPRERAEETHRCENERAEDHAEHGCRDGLPEGQPEYDGEGTEHGGRERVQSGPFDPHEVQSRCRAIAIGNGLDPMLLDRSTHLLPALRPNRGLRSTLAAAGGHCKRRPPARLRSLAHGIVRHLPTLAPISTGRTRVWPLASFVFVCRRRTVSSPKQFVRVNPRGPDGQGLAPTTHEASDTALSGARNPRAHTAYIDPSGVFTVGVWACDAGTLAIDDLAIDEA